MNKLNIKKLKVGQMEANCYLLWDKSGNSVIIDPGDDADFIVQGLNSNELTPRAIIATHGHFDHIMAVLELKLGFRVPFYMHKSDEFLLERLEKTAKHFVNFDPGPPPDVDIYLKDKSTLVIGDIELMIIHTPGHTPGSVCLYSKTEKALFSGDLIFEGGGRGRTDFSYSNVAEFLDSVSKIMGLPEETTVYPGHGEEFMLNSVIDDRLLYAKKRTNGRGF